MVLLKKLIFAPFFLLAFVLLISQLNSLLASYDFIFSLSFDSLIQLIKIAALIVVSALFFCVFVTLAADWKLILPVSILAALTPLLSLNINLAIVFAIIILVSLFLTYLTLENTLKSYLTFSASSLLGPALRRLSTLLILSFSLLYFLSSGKMITESGFQIPDSLIDTALKMTPLPQEQTSTSALPEISPDQIEMLKKNPQLLKQYGLDPKMLDALATPQKALQAPQNLLNETIKQTVKDQFQNLIKPYQSFIPAVLATLLFITLQSLISIFNLLIYPLLWFIFFVLEKTGFVRFETEQRPVKKLVV